MAELWCTSPDDCGGYWCGGDSEPRKPMGVERLVLECSSLPEIERSLRRACRTLEDCPKRGKHGFEAFHCEEAFPHLPPGAKWCVYGAE